MSDENKEQKELSGDSPIRELLDRAFKDDESGNHALLAYLKTEKLHEVSIGKVAGLFKNTIARDLKKEGVALGDASKFLENLAPFFPPQVAQQAAQAAQQAAQPAPQDVTTLKRQVEQLQKELQIKDTELSVTKRAKAFSDLAAVSSSSAFKDFSDKYKCERVSLSNFVIFFSPQQNQQQPATAQRAHDSSKAEQDQQEAPKAQDHEQESSKAEQHEQAVSNAQEHDKDSSKAEQHDQEPSKAEQHEQEVSKAQDHEQKASKAEEREQEASKAQGQQQESKEEEKIDTSFDAIVKLQAPKGMAEKQIHEQYFRKVCASIAGVNLKSTDAYAANSKVFMIDNHSYRDSCASSVKKIPDMLFFNPLLANKVKSKWQFRNLGTAWELEADISTPKINSPDNDAVGSAAVGGGLMDGLGQVLQWAAQYFREESSDNQHSGVHKPFLSVITDTRLWVLVCIRVVPGSDNLLVTLTQRLIMSPELLDILRLMIAYCVR